MCGDGIVQGDEGGGPQVRESENQKTVCRDDVDMPITLNMSKNSWLHKIPLHA